jgi:ribosome-associated protein
MANPYVEKEVKKIVEELSGEYPKNIALAAAWIIANFKGINIKIFDVKESSSLCDYNIIASMQNTTQARAVIDELSANLKKNGNNIISIEGLTDAEWILLDAGDIIIHLFQETARDIFDLDNLWGAFPQIEIPSDYYFSSPEIEQPVAKQEDPTDNYF